VWVRPSTGRRATQPPRGTATGGATVASSATHDARAARRSWRNTFDFMPDGQSLVILRQLQSSATTVQVQTAWNPF
jgi:hypothetical protein